MLNLNLFKDHDAEPLSYLFAMLASGGPSPSAAQGDWTVRDLSNIWVGAHGDTPGAAECSDNTKLRAYVWINSGWLGLMVEAGTSQDQGWIDYSGATGNYWVHFYFEEGDGCRAEIWLGTCQRSDGWPLGVTILERMTVTGSVTTFWDNAVRRWKISMDRPGSGTWYGRFGCSKDR